MPAWVRAFCITLIVYAATAEWNCPYDHSEHLIQAWQWLHGKLWVEGYGIHEVATYGAHQYIVHPPFPSIVDLPFVALLVPLHIVPRQVYLSIVVGAATSSLVLLYTDSWLLWAFFSFGTVFWYEATLGTVWGFCLVLSCFPTLMALRSIKDGKDSFWVGLWASLAALTRYDLVLCWPLYLIWLWLKGGDAHKSAESIRAPADMTRAAVGRITHALYPMAAALLLYVLWNESRYHSVTDIGLWLWYNVDTAGRAAHPALGPFSISYLPLNLYTALFMAPDFVPYYPWVIPTVMGQALLLTSPALVLSLQAPWRSGQVRLLWLLAIASIGPSMLVYSNGVQQLGFRYAIQTLPFLIALMSKAPGSSPPSPHYESPLVVEQRFDQLRLVLVAMSVLLVANGLFVLRF